MKPRSSARRASPRPRTRRGSGAPPCPRGCRLLSGGVTRRLPSSAAIAGVAGVLAAGLIDDDLQAHLALARVGEQPPSPTPTSRRVSGEAPMPALRPVVSSPLPSEPDLRVPPHPALHEHWSGRPLVQLPLLVKYPLPVQAAARRYSPATSFRPIVLLAHWTPSPCRRLSRSPWWRVTTTTTTGPPPRPDGNSGRCACPKPRRVRRAPPGRFPRSLTDRSAGSAPSCTPEASPRATATRPTASTDRSTNGRPRRSRSKSRTEHPNNP